MAQPIVLVVPRPAPTVVFLSAVGKWARASYAQAIYIYLSIRVVGVLVLAAMAAKRNQVPLDRLISWDGWWYVRLADSGYGGIPKTVDAAGQAFPDAPMAFFPLYPQLMHLVSLLPGVSTITGGLIVSIGAGIAAACALLRIGQLVDGRNRVGLILVALWAAAPMSIVLTMTYTEALFTALALWTLVGLLERRWLMVATCCFFAGLTRSTSLVLIAVVLAAVVVAFCQGRDRWRAVACGVVAPLGLVGYLSFVAAHTGSLTGWQDIELRGWRTSFDGGVEAGKFFVANLTRDGSVMQTGVVLVLVGALALVAVSVATRVPWQLFAYGAGVLALVIGTAGLPYAKARFLLPAATLLIPVAAGLANRRPRTAVAVLVGLVLVGAWWSGNSLTGWEYAI